jgi:hypothetical protein
MMTMLFLSSVAVHEVRAVLLQAALHCSDSESELQHYRSQQLHYIPGLCSAHMFAPRPRSQGRSGGQHPEQPPTNCARMAYTATLMRAVLPRLCIDLERQEVAWLSGFSRKLQWHAMPHLMPCELIPHTCCICEYVGGIIHSCCNLWFVFTMFSILFCFNPSCWCMCTCARQGKEPWMHGW